MIAMLTLMLPAAEKTTEELIAEKQKEQTETAEKNTLAEIAPAEKLASEKLAAFRTELKERLKQNADTLAKRRATPDQKKNHDYLAKVYSEADKQWAKFKKEGGKTLSSKWCT